MGRRSIILASFAAVIASVSVPGPALAQPGGGHGGGAAGHPSAAGPIGRPIYGPGVVPNPGQLPSQPFAGGLAGRSRGVGPGFGAPPLEGQLVGDNFGFTTFGGDLRPDELPYESPGPYGAPLPPLRIIPGIGPIEPCAAPRIIRIGRGLEHPARTRVVYGAPPCGYP